MRVDIEKVLKIQEDREKINSIPLENIEWYKNGVQVFPDEGVVDMFVFTGLNNFDFIDGYGEFLMTKDG